MNTIADGVVTQAALAEYFRLAEWIAELTKELDAQKKALHMALNAGVPLEPCTPGGFTAHVKTTSRVVPAWKDIALGLGADEDAIRATTTPTISRTLVVEHAAAGVAATPKIYPSAQMVG